MKKERGMKCCSANQIEKAGEYENLIPTGK